MNTSQIRQRARTVVPAALFGVALGLSLVTAAGAQEPAKARQAESAAFEALKSLAGTWEHADKDGDGKPDGISEFKVSSGGSVVIESMLPGSDYEMTNTYVLDGRSLLVTHYCAMGNQPRMACNDLHEAKTIAFKFRDGGNMNARKDSYMGGLTVTIVDANHITEAWTYFEAGKPKSVMTFELSRKS